MTLEEKVAQMMATWQDKKLILDGLDFSVAKACETYPHGIGQLSRPSDKQGGPRPAERSGDPRDRSRTPRQTVDFVNDVKRWATTVRIELPPRAFSLWNHRMEEVIEPGVFDIGVGPDSVNLKDAELRIV